MGWIFFALFVLVPLVEIFGFIQIGALIGTWATIGVVILTAIVGSMLLQHQGMGAFFKAQEKLRAGEIPLDQVVDGVCLAFAGALLLTPGFFTDAFGLALFVPPFRRWIAGFIFTRFIAPNVTTFPPTTETSEEAPINAEFNEHDGPIIDGTFEEKGSGGKPAPMNGGSDQGSSSPWQKSIDK